jgi:hypothetical protein
MGRHILGSQIFDYWHDPDKMMVEHFTDGDLFDNTVEVGWAPMTASGLYQWGPPVNRNFLGTKPSPRMIRNVVRALHADNEINLSRMFGMLKGMTQ